MSEVRRGQSRAPGFTSRLVSIGWKLGLAVVVVVTTAMAVAFFHFTAREKAGLVDAKQQAAEMVADLFAASLRAPLDFVDEGAVKSELDNLRQNRDVIEASVWLTGRDAPIGRAILEQVTVHRPDLARLCELARSTGGEAGVLAERLSARSLGEITGPLSERAFLNKRARIEVDGREVLVQKAASSCASTSSAANPNS
jgi:hypothetical protein